MSQYELSSIFSNAGKTPGIEIWRVDAFNLVTVEVAQHGRFYHGDCYIVFESIGDSTRMSHRLFYWIGKDSSVDEQGAAAIIAVQFDQAFSDVPVQCREEDGNESLAFRRCFASGVQRVNGEMSKSAFNATVTNEDSNKRILRVKGHVKTVDACEVAFEWASLTTDDCYILEVGENVFTWYGKKANPFERNATTRLADHILSEQQRGRGKIVRLEEGDRSSLLLAELGEMPSEFPESGVSDHEQSALSTTKVAASPKLYKCSNDEGKLEVSQVQSLKRASLENDDVYVLDCHEIGKLYVWVGDTALTNEKRLGMQYAKQILEDNGYERCSIERFERFNEPDSFKQYFPDWANANAL